jgi:hypothetical protein
MIGQHGMDSQLARWNVGDHEGAIRSSRGLVVLTVERYAKKDAAERNPAHLIVGILERE